MVVCPRGRGDVGWWEGCGGDGDWDDSMSRGGEGHRVEVVEASGGGD